MSTDNHHLGLYYSNDHRIASRLLGMSGYMLQYVYVAIRGCLYDKGRLAIIVMTEMKRKTIDYPMLNLTMGVSPRAGSLKKLYPKSKMFSPTW